MQFQPIREQYLYGEFAINGQRMAEVIRVDNCGHWDVFLYISNHMVPKKAPYGTPLRLSYANAKAKAIEFLTSTKECQTNPCPSTYYLPKERQVNAA